MKRVKSPSLLNIDLNTGRWLAILALLVGLAMPQARAQLQTSQPSEARLQQPPDEAGGPQGDLGPMAVPRQKVEPPPPPPPPKIPQPVPEYSLSVNVPVVTVDAMVLSKDGHFIPGVKKECFRVIEDGVPQEVTAFSQTEAPITAVLLIEFANNNRTTAFLADALRAAYAFADGLKKNDWVAIVEFDMNANILLDFTQDKAAVQAALGHLRMPGFSERNLFDALYDALDRVDGIKGRKEIVVIGSGVDTFSRVTYDKLMKKIRETPNVTIFTVSTGRAFNEWLEAHYGMSPTVQMRSLEYLQADNQMATFAKLTGGRWYNPRFAAEFPEVFRDISSSVRNQYTLTYKPSNAKLDGGYRKLKVELIDPATDKPLVIRDQKNKEVKYSVVAREGYTARRVVE
jgi:VWFA-related protein